MLSFSQESGFMMIGDHVPGFDVRNRLPTAQVRLVLLDCE